MVDGGVRRWVNGCRNAVLPCWGSLLLLGIREAEARHSLARKGVIKLAYKLWRARTISSSQEFPTADRQKTFLINKYHV